MIPYMLLLLIPAMFCFVAVTKRDKSALKLGIGKNEFIKNNNLALPIFFVMLFVLLALRDKSVGRDLDNYKYIFDSVRADDLKNIWSFDAEFLFKVLIWVVGLFTDDYQWFLATAALLTVLPIALVYCKDRTHSFVKIALFVNMSTFVMMFSGLRQSIAMAIGMFAFLMVRDKKPVRFLLLVLLALCFHTSAFMLIFMYPVYNITLKKKHLLFIIPAMLALFIFNDAVFSVLLSVYNAFVGGDESITQTGALGSLVLFALLAVFAYVIPDESKIDREVIGLRNFLLFAVALQCFAPLHSLAMRMNYYYILFIPLAIGKILQIPAPRFRQVARLGEIVIILFFVFEFVYGIYDSYITGVSALDTVPYIPFWRG